MLAGNWDDRKEAYDFVIVGSGYGGAVTAARLAAADLDPRPSVCILERGREWPARSFPDTLGGYLAETVGPLNPLGLYETLHFQDISVVKGSGLGGSSLINANVALIPDEELFALAQWPRSLTRGSLLAYYRRALDVLAVRPHPRAGQFPKFRALDLAAGALGLKAEPVDLSVNFQIDGENPYGMIQAPCVDCGDCFTGCNYNAKNTLYMNYLPMARRAGAEIYTQARVDWIEKQADGGWRVHGRRFRTRSRSEAFSLAARNVILAAGAINTTEILMRSEAKGLKVSPRLGSAFSGNGDFYAVAYNSDHPIQALGFGRHPEGPGALVPPGPTIVGIVRANRDRPPMERFVVEDAAIPAAFVRAAQIAFASLRGEDTDTGDESAERRRRLADLSQAHPYSPDGALFHTLALLVTSMDDARGSLVFDTPWWNRSGRLRIYWDDVGRQESFRRLNRALRRQARALGATFLENAFWTTFDLRRLVTVHPLGGCPIGEDYFDGAADGYGRVFSADGSVHEGLFVADGSMVPSALGVNPFLTIAALAERVAERKIEQMRGKEYPEPAVSVAGAGLDPRETIGARDAELEKLFRRCPHRGLEGIVNKGEHRIDTSGRLIYNDACWKGFLPKGLPLGELAARLHAGYERRFWMKGARCLGETRCLDGRIALRHTLEEVAIDRRVNDLDPGEYILLRFTDPPFDSLFYEVLKLVSEEVVIYRSYTGAYPDGRRGWTAPLLRKYGFEQMSVEDHRRIYEMGKPPSAAELHGVWRMDAVANANHAQAVAYLCFDHKPDGRLEARYQLLGLLEGMVMPSFVSNHFQLHDFTPFHDEIRSVDKDFMVGQWVADLPDGIADVLPAGSLGLLHVSESESKRKRFGFHYILSRSTPEKAADNPLLRPFLEALLPEGIGMNFDEGMDGWYFPGLAPEGSGYAADRMILARIPAKGEPSGASAVRGKFSIQAVDLNEFIEDASHEAAIAGSLTFADWEGAGEHSFPLDSGRSRFHYLRVDPDTGEAETIYNLEFGTPAGRRFLLAGRKYMQKDREGRFRGPGEVLEDYTTLFFRLHEIQGDGTAARGAGVLKFRTFEDLAAVRNLAEVLGGFRITGTNDPLLKLRARMRFLAFTASFVQHEYDPLSPDAGSLREDVQNEVLRGADTPDFFSTRPTADLHSVLRNTPALPLQALLNTGEVRIDFERRRIFRDSFWKGSFAADTLLGWEERVRNALLGSGAGQAGSIFAGGSFWKRFDSIEGTTARGQVVNYELSFLPGDPEVREVKYPDDNRRYFRKDDTILLLNYRNNPYRIVYDAIKVIDEQNAIGVMHLGKFPDGVEFATFVMARHNYPFEKMAVEDHRALFSHPRATIPDVQELSGEWTGHLVFLNRPNVSLLNQANPALLNATFTPASTTLGITYRLSLSGPAGLGPWSLDFTARKDGAALSAELRRIDADTLVGLWQVPELPPGRLVQLQDWLDVLRERPVFRFVLTRR